MPEHSTFQATCKFNIVEEVSVGVRVRVRVRVTVSVGVRVRGKVRVRVRSTVHSKRPANSTSLKR